jgi:hypothetical protein
MKEASIASEKVAVTLVAGSTLVALAPGVVFVTLGDVVSVGGDYLGKNAINCTGP